MGEEERVKRKLVQLGIAAIVGSVAVLLGARLAVATVQDANGTVHGCLKKSNAQVYLIDPSTGQTCGKDMPLDWNKTGATGSQGVDGPKGYTGPQGTAGSSGYEQTYDQETTDSSGNGSAEADCPSGKVAIAGGYELSGPKAMTPLHSAPTSDGSGWVVDVTNAPSQTLIAFAVCATDGGS
jgi:hypothetical protein